MPNQILSNQIFIYIQRLPKLNTLDLSLVGIVTPVQRCFLFAAHPAAWYTINHACISVLWYWIKTCCQNSTKIVNKGPGFKYRRILGTPTPPRSTITLLCYKKSVFLLIKNPKLTMAIFGLFWSKMKKTRMDSDRK